MDCIKKYIMSEYAVKGRGNGYYDCWGLVHAYYTEVLGILVPSYVDDYDTPVDVKALRLFLEETRKQWIKIDLSDATEGDVIVFKICGLPRHIGILFGNKMLHIMKGSQVTFEKYNTPYWNNRIYGVYRHEKRI